MADAPVNISALINQFIAQPSLERQRSLQNLISERVHPGGADFTRPLVKKWLKALNTVYVPEERGVDNPPDIPDLQAGDPFFATFATTLASYANTVGVGDTFSILRRGSQLLLNHFFHLIRDHHTQVDNFPDYLSIARQMYQMRRDNSHTKRAWMCAEFIRIRALVPTLAGLQIPALQEQVRGLAANMPLLQDVSPYLLPLLEPMLEDDLLREAVGGMANEDSVKASLKYADDLLYEMREVSKDVDGEEVIPEMIMPIHSLEKCHMLSEMVKSLLPADPLHHVPSGTSGTTLHHHDVHHMFDDGSNPGFSAPAIGFDEGLGSPDRFGEIDATFDSCQPEDTWLQDFPGHGATVDAIDSFLQ
eukprot:gnl/Dysnectes_brevis/561_a619_3692.p1 GENE.gnl/Dysnectes_brevis/561_a619_3692~~gnl/Dysnectes_brevis/561_a619_3692.p1  ORF type:complete len:390 (+),score=50.35 gnl/Dysnectes_brevis/561_a619_3692:90-1172(+)